MSNVMLKESEVPAMTRFILVLVSIFIISCSSNEIRDSKKHSVTDRELYCLLYDKDGFTSAYHNFSSVIASMASHAPDEYPKWSYQNYETNKEMLEEDWGQLKQCFPQGSGLIRSVEIKLIEAIRNFDSGNKELARKILWDIYNNDLKKLEAGLTTISI